MRSAYMAKSLVEGRYEVMTAGLELSGIIDANHINNAVDAARFADVIILPLPVFDKTNRLRCDYGSAKPDIFSVLANAKSEARVFGGMVPKAVKIYADEREIRISDYYMREEFQIKNAVPTAEGTVEMLMKKLPVTVFSSRIAVTGFGRCAEALAVLLKAMGAKVTVYARKSEALARAECMGLKAKNIRLLSEGRLEYDALVNTVPARVFSREVLEKVSRDSVIIDLASAPGGVDFAGAARLGIDAETAPSLPGRVAPKTAGEIIKQTIFSMLTEEGFAL